MIFVTRFSVKGRGKSGNNTIVFKAIANCSVQAAWIGCVLWQNAKIREYKGIVHLLDCSV